MDRSGRILVVDDERSIRRLLNLYLTKEGFTVVEAADGIEGLSLLRRGDIDVALIDVMLPGMDGFELVRKIREELTIPIILITARGEETNRVAGLEVGADDYVVKPFSAPEVVARVRAQLRRTRGFSTQDAHKAGRIEIDPRARRVSVDGRAVELTRREFDLLETLLRNRGLVQSREQLLESAWGSTFLLEKTVDVHIAALRRKLGEAFRVTALRGVGYRLDQ